MFREFAVEPSIFESKSNVRQYLPYLVPEHGRLVSVLPPSWEKKAKKAILSLLLGPVEESLMLDYVQSVCAGAIERPHVLFDDQKSWIENAIIENGRESFHAILSDSECSEPNALRADSIQGRDSLWDICGDERILKRAECLADHVSALLRSSNTILIIDPYFTPLHSGFVQGVAALIRASCERRCGPPPKIHLYSDLILKSGGAIANREDFFLFTEEKLSPHIPSGVTIDVFLLCPKPQGDDFHDRFIVTEKGGLSVTHGIDARPNKQSTTLLTRLGMRGVEGVFNDHYHSGTRKYKLIDGPRSVVGRSRI